MSYSSSPVQCSRSRAGSAATSIAGAPPPDPPAGSSTTLAQAGANISWKPWCLSRPTSSEPLISVIGLPETNWCELGPNLLVVTSTALVAARSCWSVPKRSRTTDGVTVSR